MTTPPPPPIRWAAVIAIVQSLLGIAYAVLLLIRQFSGADFGIVEEDGSDSWAGLGTAVFFLIVFGVVIAGAIVMARGTHRWGRGPVAILEMIFLPIAVTMWQGHAPWLAVFTGLSAVCCLALLFCGPSVRWASGYYGENS